MGKDKTGKVKPLAGGASSGARPPQPVSASSLADVELRVSAVLGCACEWAAGGAAACPHPTAYGLRRVPVPAPSALAAASTRSATALLPEGRECPNHGRYTGVPAQLQVAAQKHTARVERQPIGPQPC